MVPVRAHNFAYFCNNASVNHCDGRECNGKDDELGAKTACLHML